MTATSTLSTLRAKLRGRALARGEKACAACDSPGPHTEAQCKARRPLCHTGCGNRTCIQARANGCEPTCLGCYFDKRIVARIETAQVEAA